MESIELNQFWEQVKVELIKSLPENVHPWIHPLEVSGFDKGVLTVVTGQIMGRDLLRKNHYKQIVAFLLYIKNKRPRFITGVGFYFLSKLALTVL